MYGLLEVVDNVLNLKFLLILYSHKGKHWIMRVDEYFYDRVSIVKKKIKLIGYKEFILKRNDLIFENIILLWMKVI